MRKTATGRRDFILGGRGLHHTIFKTILSISHENRWTLIAILLAGISQTFVGMYATVFFQRLIDGFPAARQLSDLAPALAGYIGFNVLNHTLIYLEGIPSSILNHRVALWVKLRALQKIARLDYQAYRDLGTGNLIQTIENGADATRNILSGFYLQILRGILPPLFISLAFIRYYDQTLFLIILGGYGIFYLISYALMHFLRREMEKMLANQEDFSKFSVRAFMEMVVFRVNGRFKAEFERVRGISDEIVRSRAKIYLLQELFFTGFALLIFLIEAGVVIQQASKILAGASTVGTLVALVNFIRIVFWPITTFSMALIGYRLDAVTFAHFHRFFSLPDDRGLGRGKELVIARGQIEFRGVTFAYQEDGRRQAGEPAASPAPREVLRDFSQVFQGGQVTALVGASGSGKSTLVRLLLHLLKPQQGQVLVDGQDLSQTNLETYYRCVAYIPQEPPIFDGSLRENLLFDRPVEPALLAEVIQKVGLGDLVARLPQGLETIVGERGIKLSGGERQRLSFGRVLLQDPRIILLDEPTSALDSLSEDFVTHNLLAMLQGKTVIVVAHRLQTVRSADQILVMEDGQVVQAGTFNQLLAQSGRFYQLWQKQTREDDPLVADRPAG